MSNLKKDLWPENMDGSQKVTRVLIFGIVILFVLILPALS